MKVESSVITLKNIHFYAYHGVLAQERIVGNDYIVNISLNCNLQKAFLSDDVGDTISYAEVLDCIKSEMKTKCNLLEKVAYNIGEKLFNKFDKINSITIEVCKVNPPMGMDGDGASVILNLIK